MPRGCANCGDFVVFACFCKYCLRLLVGMLVFEVLAATIAVIVSLAVA